MGKNRAAARAALTAFAALAAVSAHAADRLQMPVKAPPQPAPASWTQFYVGGGIGFDAERGRSSVNAGGAVGAVFSIEGFQGASLGLSATAGFDLQVAPQFVVGGFADYDWSHQDTTIALNSGGNLLSATALRLDGGWTIGGRAGVLLAPDALLYGLGGFTQMRVNNWGFATTGFTLQEPTQTLGGYTVGAGIEYRLASNISLRGEYRYLSLARATTVDTTNNLLWVTDISAHMGRLMAAYRFGGPGMAAPVPPMRMPLAAWNGFYGAIGIGADAISRNLHTEIPGVAAFDTTGLGGADLAGTLMVGFDHQLIAGWVAGIFGSYEFASNGNARFAIDVAGADFSTDMASVDQSWTLGGRAGYLIAPDALVYGLAGYTKTTFHQVSYDLLFVAGTAVLPDFHGLTLGGGFEKLITDNVSMRAEYRNTRFETQSGYPAPGLVNTQSQPTINSVRFLVAYRLATR
jgi:outer membrane immunogenic protein